MAPHRDATGGGPRDRPPAGSEGSRGVRRGRGLCRDDRVPLRPRRVRRGRGGRPPDDRGLPARPRGAVRAVLQSGPRPGWPAPPWHGGRGPRAREVLGGPLAQGPGDAAVPKNNLRPEPVLRLVLRPRRDRGRVPRPALREPQPPAVRGAIGEEELLLAPREGEAPVPGADRGARRAR